MCEFRHCFQSEKKILCIDYNRDHYFDAEYDNQDHDGDGDCGVKEEDFLWQILIRIMKGAVRK